MAGIERDVRRISPIMAALSRAAARATSRVDGEIKPRPTANAIMKQAGIDHRF